MSAAVDHFDNLDAAELAMLGHALRIVPYNACLTGPSALAPGKSIAMFSEIDAFKTLWEKVAKAIKERDDLADYRDKRDAA